MTVHEYRLKGAKAEWDRDARSGSGARRRWTTARSATTRRSSAAIVDWMTADPKPEHLPELLARLERVKPEDTHLRHAIRIALRETLRDPAALTALGPAEFNDAELRAVADVMLGLPTKDAADFLAGAPQGPDRRRQAGWPSTSATPAGTARGTRHLRVHHRTTSRTTCG